RMGGNNLWARNVFPPRFWKMRPCSGQSLTLRVSSEKRGIRSGRKSVSGASECAGRFLTLKKARNGYRPTQFWVSTDTAATGVSLFSGRIVARRISIWCLELWLHGKLSAQLPARRNFLNAFLVFERTLLLMVR